MRTPSATASLSSRRHDSDNSEEEESSLDSDSDNDNKKKRPRSAKQELDEEIANKYSTEQEKNTKKPRTKSYLCLTPAQLTSNDGLIRILHEFPTQLSNFYQPGRKGQEPMYATQLIKAYTKLCRDLAPQLAFTDALAKIDNLGSKKEVRVYLQQMRDNQRNNILDTVIGRVDRERLLAAVTGSVTHHDDHDKAAAEVVAENNITTQSQPTRDHDEEEIEADFGDVEPSWNYSTHNKNESEMPSTNNPEVEHQHRSEQNAEEENSKEKEQSPTERAHDEADADDHDAEELHQGHKQTAVDKDESQFVKFTDDFQKADRNQNAEEPGKDTSLTQFVNSQMMEFTPDNNADENDQLEALVGDYTQATSANEESPTQLVDTQMMEFTADGNEDLEALVPIYAQTEESPTQLVDSQKVMEFAPQDPDDVNGSSEPLALDETQAAAGTEESPTQLANSQFMEFTPDKDAPVNYDLETLVPNYTQATSPSEESPPQLVDTQMMEYTPVNEEDMNEDSEELVPHQTQTSGNNESPTQLFNTQMMEFTSGNEDEMNEDSEALVADYTQPSMSH